MKKPKSLLQKAQIQNLKWGDVNFAQDVLRVPFSKNGEMRYIQMNEAVKNVLIGVKKQANSPYI